MIQYQIPGNSTNGYGRGFGLTARGGYQVSREDYGPKAATYFEGGIGIGPYFGSVTYYNFTGGGSNTQSANGFRYYFYLETVPIRLGNWGFGIGLEPGWS